MTDELRDRVLRLEWRGRGWDEKLGGLEKDLRLITDRLDGMTKAEELADAVTAAISQARRGRLTMMQRVAGAIIALVLAVPAAHDLSHWLGFA